MPFFFSSLWATSVSASSTAFTPLRDTPSPTLSTMVWSRALLVRVLDDALVFALAMREKEHHFRLKSSQSRTARTIRADRSARRGLHARVQFGLEPFAMGSWLEPIDAHFPGDIRCQLLLLLSLSCAVACAALRLPPPGSSVGRLEVARAAPLVMWWAEAMSPVEAAVPAMVVGCPALARGAPQGRRSGRGGRQLRRAPGAAAQGAGVQVEREGRRERGRSNGGAGGEPS